MTERLLQYIWQFQHFNKGELRTTDGEPIHIISPGLHNTNQGPDFINAKLRIANTTWAGHVELHIKTNDWDRHGHQYDPNYNNVILHVVWQHVPDKFKPATATDILRKRVPVLELASRVPLPVLNKYRDLMQGTRFIACEKSIGSVSDLVWKSWKDRLLAERLLKKAGHVQQLLKENNQHWEETFWWMLARNFGAKVNAAPFEEMARSIPLNVLARMRPNLFQLEAMLLGQAGLLEKTFVDAYPEALRREYQFQQQKYELKKAVTPVCFLRMRPVNFPAVRLAQLAVLIHQSVHLFTKIKEAGSISDVKTLLSVRAAGYWDTHYRFDETAAFREKNLGAGMMENIIVNTIVPVLFAWGDQHDDNHYREKAISLLEETQTESNHIIRGFKQVGITTRHAFDSQALIEMKNEYCNHKRCLDCGVGNALLRRAT